MKELVCDRCQREVVSVADDAVGVLCWRCTMGLSEGVKEKDREYRKSVSGADIKKVRKAKGWSQAAMAAKFRTNQAYISQMETGKKLPTLEIVEFIKENL